MRTIIAVAVSSWLLAALHSSPPACAQVSVEDAPRILDEITFGGARPGSVQQTNGVRARGNLVSLTAEQVVMRRQQKTFEIPMDKVRSITTTDGNFSYAPGDETFDSLLRRCRRIPGVTIGKTEVYDPIGPDSPDVASNPRRNQAAEAPMPEAPTTDATTPAPDKSNPGTARTGPSATAAGDPAPGSTVAMCASCKETVPPSLKNGDRCPHCGVIIWNGPTVIESMSTNTSPTGTGTEPGGAGAAGGDGAYPTATGTGTGTAVPAGTTPIEGGVPASSLGGTFANTPLWMKVALFGGLLVVIWLLLQRR